MAGEYPTSWDEIAEAVKAVAGWCCEHCGHPHDVAGGYVLTVHHLDGDKSHCSHANLVALCQRCHLHWQHRYQPGQLWLFAAPEWAERRGLNGAAPAWDWDLTRVDRELLAAIAEHRRADGWAWSLFDLAVARAGVSYNQAHARMKVLESLNYVEVRRAGPGRPLGLRLSRQIVT